MIDYTLPLDKLPNPLPIEPLRKPFDVTITPPGSKSITCRAYVLAALAKGESKIIRPLRADDTDKLLDALCTLGAQARWEGDDVYITGVNGRFPRGGSVNLGDGGAPTRFMIACACLAAEPVIVDGSKRMRERPIAEGVEMLRQLGAKIEYVEAAGRLPVRVRPSKQFLGGKVNVGKTLSSQSISALLLIAWTLPAGLEIHFDQARTSFAYTLLTSNMMEEWEQDHFIEDESNTIIVDFRERLKPSELQIEPDASSAIYWVVAASLTASRVQIPSLRMATGQPDAQLLYALRPQITAVQDWPNRFRDLELGWPIVEGAFTPCTWCEASFYPDGAMALAVALSTIGDKSRISELETLRVKETDRIAALANELRQIGCTVETTDDSITIDPSSRHDKPVTIETYNDHRMAMAFAVLGLARPGISIKDPHVVSKSYPTFWKDFAKLYQ